MIFGVLNPEQIWHQQLVHLPTSPVYCSHFTLGNPKSHSYFRLVTLSQKKKQTVASLPPLHLKNVTHYLVKLHKFFIFFIFFMCMEYQFAIWTSCGTAASCCDMGWISAEHGGWYSWSVAKKDWKHVCVQKVVTLNICCDVAYLTFHLPHITTNSFHSHQCQHTTGSFQIHQRLEKRTYLQSDENVVHFTR